MKMKKQIIRTMPDGVCSYGNKAEDARRKASSKRLITEIAKDNGLDKRFVKFMQLRFPYEHFTPYIMEWVERIKTGSAWTRADSATKRAILKAGYTEREASHGTSIFARD